MIVRIVFVLSCLLHTSQAMKFSIVPTTFISGATASVNMRCEVAESGNDLLQLLLLQLEHAVGNSMVPIVTYTPGLAPQITVAGRQAKVIVYGVENQLQNISSSYLSVTFPFPADGVAGNYTCALTGLSKRDGSLVSFFNTASLSEGKVDQLPRFMTEYAVELRLQIEQIKAQKSRLLEETATLQAEEQNITTELALLEKEFHTLIDEMSALQSRASQLFPLLNQPIHDLDHLSSVRPGKKVAFHAGISTLGARTAVLHQPLVFDHVMTNEGEGYDATTGVFRAPITGTYVFTVSVEAGAGGRSSELSIMLGNKILQTMHMSDDKSYQHSTTTTIAHVPAGGEVTCQFTWLEGFPGYVGTSQKNAPYVSAFTGYIIW